MAGHCVWYVTVFKTCKKSERERETLASKVLRKTSSLGVLCFNCEGNLLLEGKASKETTSKSIRWGCVVQ